MAKYLRYELDGVVRYGALSGANIQPLEGEFGDFRATSEALLPLNKVKLLAPAVPTKIIAVGPNYPFPGMTNLPPPMFWTKPATCLNHPDGMIDLPPGLPAINHEVELAIVIGKRAKQVAAAEAHHYIFGYTCMNDVTAGDFATPGAFPASPYYIHGKIFDGFAPLGPWIETEVDTKNLHLECRVNGEVRQSSSTAERLFEPADLVAMISNILTLLPGDVISTGSPAGVAPLSHGDIVEVEIEKIGTLRNYVRNRAD